MSPAGCPDRQTLAALAAGRLSGANLNAVAEHLDACPACLALAQATPADTEPIVGALCRPEPADPYVREAGCEHAVVRLRALAEAGMTCDPSTVLGTEPLRSAPTEADGCGRYRPVRLHARGGLGEVHVALDEELSREVALKRIRRPRAGDPDSRRRFLREAEITARLEHPGIVPVYGLVRSGTGEPSYAMRLIQGETLEEAIARFHGTPPYPAKPGEGMGVRGRAGDASDPHPHPLSRTAGRGGKDFTSLAFRELLGRFVAACNAIAYAHSKGVLHRDLKPANIMLGEYGETLVVDWGLAKVIETGGAASVLGAYAAVAQDGDDHTQTGQALGTPAYMSPEQAAGRTKAVGPAADVYGLGATLYAILTGQPPLEGTPVAILERVRQSKVPPPRAVNKDVPRPLEAVCRKAMALKPEDRYATPLALAADIERWLADEPVLAHREPATAQLARWGRRHKPWVAGVAGLLLTAVVALAGGLWAVNRERQQTVAERDQKELARRQAQRAFNKLTDETVERLMERLPQLTDADREFLREMLVQHQEFANAGGDSADARASIADAQFHVGLIRYKLGDVAGAEAAYRAAVDIQRQLAADFPAQPDYRADLARFHNSLGNVLAQTDRSAQAERAWRSARDIFQQLVAEVPDKPFYRHGLATCHNNLGTHFVDDPDQRPLAVEAMTAAIRVLQSLVAEFPESHEYRSELAGSHANLGVVLCLLNRSREGEDAYRAAIVLQQKLVAEFPRQPEHASHLAKGLQNLSHVLQQTGRPREAEDALRTALALKARMAADFPGVPDYRHQLAHAHIAFGDLLRQTGRAQDAEDAYRAGLTVQQKLVADYPKESEYRSHLAQTHYSLGQRLRTAGQPQQAEDAFRASRDHFQRLADQHPDAPDYRSNLAITLDRLAESRIASGDHAAARQLLEQAQPHHLAALRVNPKKPGYRDPFNTHLGLVAETLLGIGDHEKAVRAAEELSRFEREPANDHYQASGFTARCASVVLKDDRLSEARRQELARTYADRAMSLMHRAVELGFKDAAKLKKDTALESLRTRDDFRKLVDELEVAPKQP